MEPEIAARLETQMSELLIEMREDLTRDPIERDFVLLSASFGWTRNSLGETGVAATLAVTESRLANSDPSGKLKTAVNLHAPFCLATTLRISSCPLSATKPVNPFPGSQSGCFTRAGFGPGSKDRTPLGSSSIREA